jgi:nitronate monooxygenase
MAEVIEEAKPAVVSFHFGLPHESLLARVKHTGAKIYSSATTVAEARWLEDRGVDAIIAQGAEAGGHRGMFLTEDIGGQPGLFALLPQVADAVRVPVIAAGGIADGRGIAAAFMLGAAAVQIGTAYLSTPQSTISAIHRKALLAAQDDSTFLTNLFTGRPARGILNRFMHEHGPMNDLAPPVRIELENYNPGPAAAAKRHGQFRQGGSATAAHRTRCREVATDIFA